MKGGFTILELTVVVAIIAILSGIGVAQFSSTKQKGRDIQRINSVNEIKKALSLYQIDTGNFPVQTTAIIITGSDTFSLALENAKVISEVPSDPLHPTMVFTYQSNSGGSDYNITFCLESNNIPNYSEGCENTIRP